MHIFCKNRVSSKTHTHNMLQLCHQSKKKWQYYRENQDSFGEKSVLLWWFLMMNGRAKKANKCNNYHFKHKFLSTLTSSGSFRTGFVHPAGRNQSQGAGRGYKHTQRWLLSLWALWYQEHLVPEELKPSLESKHELAQLFQRLGRGFKHTHANMPTCLKNAPR